MTNTCCSAANGPKMDEGVDTNPPFEYNTQPLEWDFFHGLSVASANGTRHMISDVSNSSNNIDRDGTVPLILVTGGTGFIGSHTVSMLVKLGYRVRCTVRDLRTEYAQWLVDLNRDSTDTQGSVELIECSLESSQECWNEAVTGVDTFIHCAQRVRESLIGKVATETEDMFVSSLTGLYRILQACKDAGIRRFIYTGSMGAMDEDNLGKPNATHRTRVMHCKESMWTPIQKARQSLIHSYLISKSCIEMAFWKWLRRQESPPFEATVIAPSLIVGPTINGRKCSSHDCILYCQWRNVPSPDVEYVLVDVRDVALSLISALQKPKSIVDGKRYLVAHCPVPMMHLAHYFHNYCHSNGLEKYASEWALCMSPKPIALIIGLILTETYTVNIVHWAGKRFVDNSRSKQELGVQYIPVARMLQDSLDSLFQYDLVTLPTNSWIPSPQTTSATALASALLLAGYAYHTRSKL